MSTSDEYSYAQRKSLAPTLKYRCGPSILKRRIGKLWPVGEVYPNACFYRGQGLTNVSFHLEALKNKSQDSILAWEIIWNFNSMPISNIVLGHCHIGTFMFGLWRLCCYMVRLSKCGRYLLSGPIEKRFTNVLSEKKTIGSWLHQ